MKSFRALLLIPLLPVLVFLFITDLFDISGGENVTKLLDAVLGQ